MVFCRTSPNNGTMESKIETMRFETDFMEKLLRILILEDQASDADLIEFELEEAGIPFTSRRAWTEQGYLQALEEFSPDVILSDYDLPQYSGALALEAVKRLSPETPFILVTGAITEYNGLCTRIVTQGARECVLKNHLEQLGPAVRKVINENA
jgi:CheY-like chemotaxis protein